MRQVGPTWQNRKTLDTDIDLSRRWIRFEEDFDLEMQRWQGFSIHLSNAFDR